MLLIIAFTTVSWLQGHSLDLNTTSWQVSKMSVSVEELLNRLCPSVDICNLNATNAEIKPNGLLDLDTVSCCTGCSCHPECKERSNCCFPNTTDTDMNIEPSTSRYQCLNSVIGNSYESLPAYVPAYYTIVSAPKGGCVSKGPFEMEYGLRLYPSCDHEPDGRSYFPVYSKTTGEIYKNIKCAMCHGIKDPHYLNPMLICRKGGRANKKPFSVIPYLIDYGKPPVRCYVRFRFPRFFSQKRCYQSVFGTCQSESVLALPELDIPGLNRSLARTLCENSVYSPFSAESRIYKNVFCYLCNHRLQKSGYFECSFDVFERSEGTTFISILDPIVYLDQGAALRQELYPEACSDVNEILGEVKCHRVYCPLTKMMNKDGSCVFISNYVTSPLFVYLKLIPVGGEDFRLQTRNVDIKEFQNSLIKNSPWPIDWTIRIIYAREDDFICKEKANILVDLVSDKTKLSEYIPEIENILNLPWTLVLNDTVFVFRQSLREYELSRLHIISETVHIDHVFLGCDLVTWWTKVISKERPTVAPITISKLYFCHQIKLGIKEFELIGPKQSYLRSNVTKFVLAAFEFELIIEEDGFAARVCLEDTILKPRQRNRGTRNAKAIAGSLLILNILISLMFCGGLSRFLCGLPLDNFTKKQVKLSK